MKNMKDAFALIFIIRLKKSDKAPPSPWLKDAFALSRGVLYTRFHGVSTLFFDFFDFFVFCQIILTKPKSRSKILCCEQRRSRQRGPTAPMWARFLFSGRTSDHEYHSGRTNQDPVRVRGCGGNI